MVREIFDPIFERQTLLSKPNAERENLEPKFWRERTIQRRDLATVAALVMDRVFEEPDVTLDDLKSTVEEYQDETRIAPFQEKLVTNLIREFGKRRQKVLTLRNEFPDDRELLVHANPYLSKQLSRASVHADVRPITIHFCVDRRHYPLLRGEKLIASGGFYRPGTPYTYENWTSGNGQRTLLHEEMHALYDFVKPSYEKALGKSLFFRPAPSDRDGVNRLRNEGLGGFEGYLHQLLASKSDRMKDELLAFTREAYRPGRTMETLMRPADKQGLYDYFQKQRDSTETALVTSGLRADLIHGAVDMLNKQFPQWHKKLVEDGLDTLRYLLVTKRLSFMEATFLLLDVPLERWPMERKNLQELG